MTDAPNTDPETAAGRDPAREALLDAVLAHVPFDGWSETSFRAACADAGMTPDLGRALYPRGPVDLALAFHARGDAKMAARMRATDLGAMRFRDRVALAIRWRLEAVEDREAVRRGSTLFALPQHVADGSRAIWGTADLILRLLGDRDTDLNWYTKRASLSAVYGSTVLYWLGDDSPGHEATWAFLERRIDDVMRVEAAKARLREAPVLSKLMAGPEWLAARIRAPKRAPGDLPGRRGGLQEERA